MRRSSKIYLAICAFALVYIVMVYMQVAATSRKDFTREDAVIFMKELSEAFQREDASAVLSFAWDDAKVAGQDLAQIRNLLHQVFANMKDPKIEYRDVQVIRDRDFATVSAIISVTDRSTGTTPYPAQPVAFKLERRKVSYLLNLIQSYDWKVGKVEGNIPSAAL
jgi:ketosteroid isomerase-like protein